MSTVDGPHALSSASTPVVPSGSPQPGDHTGVQRCRGAADCSGVLGGPPQGPGRAGRQQPRLSGCTHAVATGCSPATEPPYSLHSEDRHVPTSGHQRLIAAMCRVSPCRRVAEHHPVCAPTAPACPLPSLGVHPAVILKVAGSPWGITLAHSCTRRHMCSGMAGTRASETEVPWVPSGRPES